MKGNVKHITLQRMTCYIIPVETNLHHWSILDNLQQILLLTKQFVQWSEAVTRLEAAGKPSPSVD